MLCRRSFTEEETMRVISRKGGVVVSSTCSTQRCRRAGSRSFAARIAFVCTEYHKNRSETENITHRVVAESHEVPNLGQGDNVSGSDLSDQWPGEIEERDLRGAHDEAGQPQNDVRAPQLVQPVSVTGERTHQGVESQVDSVAGWPLDDKRKSFKFGKKVVCSLDSMPGIK